MHRLRTYGLLILLGACAVPGGCAPLPFAPGAAMKSGASSRLPATEPSAATVARLQKPAAQFGVDIAHDGAAFPVTTSFGLIEGRKPRGDALNDYVPQLVAELSPYPPELIKLAHLKRIVLCADLAVDGRRRSAVPDMEHDTLYLDVERGSYDRYYRRGVMHHDFFHMIDYRDDGLLYDDPAWKALNGADFAYGAGGVSAQGSPGTSILSDDRPGFLNHYSTTGVEEDKAEVYSYLVTRPDYMAERGARDAVLAAKAEYVKRRLVEFCPEAGADFWQRTAAVRR